MATPQTPMSLQDYGNAISPSVRQGFMDRWEREPSKLELVANVRNLVDYDQLEAGFSGLGGFELTAEAGAYKEDAILETFTTTYRPYKYTKRVPITEEMMWYDKVGISDKSSIGESMAESAMDSIQKDIASVFNNGFNTSYTSYSDGKPLFSTLHTRADGGAVFSNASSTSLPLTHDNLATEVQAMRETLDDRGKVTHIRPGTLLVPPALEAQALEIVKSAGRSDTADRADNVFGMKEYTGGSLRVVVWDYLGAAAGGSDTAWFLLADNTKKDNLGIQWLWKMKPSLGTLDDTDENKNGVFAFVGKYARAVGWSNPRGLRGSKGDSTAFSS